MISKFVQEQRRYTREEITSLLECSSTAVVRIIKKLKEYGILKAVRSTTEQLEMSDLADSDIDISDEENTSRHFYVFTFVGLIIVEGRLLKCYPKYIQKNKEPKEEIKQVIKVLQKYNSKDQIIFMYNDKEKNSSFNRLAVLSFLLNDYYENGLYTNMQEIIEVNGMGEIDWNRTINNTYPIIQRNRPYYVELQTRKRVTDDNDFFTRLHQCLLSSCSQELKDADLLDILDLEYIKLSDEDLSDLGDDDYLISKIEKELNIQFNTRKQTVLKMMIAIISNKSNIEDPSSFSLFGTNSFNLVWEKVCSVVLNNLLHTKLGDLKLETPSEDVYSHSTELINIIEKPKWKTGQIEFEAKDTLIPDLITFWKQQHELFFVILDAKYYRIKINESGITGQPGIGDITKQYLYQLAYKRFIDLYKFSGVRNCFLMPSEKDEIDTPSNYAYMNMLTDLGLEQIKYRELPAKLMYSYYLRNMKLDIGDLGL